MRLRILPVIAACLIFGSCSSTDEPPQPNPGMWDYTDCTDPPMYIVFPWYDSSDVDTVIIKKYTNNNTFSVLVDSTLVDSPYTNNSTSYDVYNDNRLKYVIQNGYDYELYIPATDTTIRISNIRTEQYRDSVLVYDSRHRTLTCRNKLLDFNITINTAPYNFQNDGQRFRFYYWDYYIIFRKGHL